MFLVAFVFLALVTVPLLGGRIGRLAGLEFRAVHLIAGALGVQILIISVIPDTEGPLLPALHLLSYALIGFFLWCNRKIPGAPVVGAGWFLNALVITVNGGVMPASPDVISSGSRGAVVGSGFLNSQTIADPNLAFLGDNFALPGWFPFHNVFSIGDVLIAAGVFIALHRVTRSLLSRAFDRYTMGPAQTDSG